MAFAKHTTVRENTGSRNQAQWARNRRSDDYELLCTDGTRKDIDEWANCNLGEIPSNAIVTAGECQRHSIWCSVMLTHLDKSEFPRGTSEFKFL